MLYYTNFGLPVVLYIVDSIIQAEEKLGSEATLHCQSKHLPHAGPPQLMMSFTADGQVRFGIMLMVR